MKIPAIETAKYMVRELYREKGDNITQADTQRITDELAKQKIFIAENFLYEMLEEWKKILNTKQEVVK